MHKKEVSEKTGFLKLSIAYRIATKAPRYIAVPVNIAIPTVCHTGNYLLNSNRMEYKIVFYPGLKIS